MNRLTPERRTAVITALCEGNSIRATCRITGTAKGTVLRLLEEIGAACADYHDRHVRGLQTRRIQVDEIWSYIGAKARNVRPERWHEAGDCWTWVGIDADTKLAIAYRVGGRGVGIATRFVRDIASRLVNRVQITTDGHKAYLEAVESAFGWAGADFAVLQKLYGTPTDGETRYSPPQCIGVRVEHIMGTPDPRHVSTSFVERQNLTMRMQVRRFTRLTNAFSKKIENHEAAVALHFMHYNFCRVHQTLTRRARGVWRTPAMAAGLASKVWTVADLVALIDPRLRKAS
jgi:IS1 family transposase